MRRVWALWLSPAPRLLALPDAAGTAQGRLHDAHAGAQGGGELHLPQSRSPVATGIEVAARDLGQARQIVGRDRFLVPQRVGGLDRLRQPDRVADGELAVGAEEQVGAVAHRRADHRQNAAERWMSDIAGGMAAAQRVGAGGVELQRRPALLDAGDRRLGLGLGFDPELVAWCGSG